MSTHRRKLRLNTVTVNLGCSSSFCRRPKVLSSIFNSKKPNPQKRSTTTRYHSSSTTSWHKVDSHSSTSTAATSPWCYLDSEPDVRSLRAVQGFGRIDGESVAVEKDSDDPYLDFRRSMLQMILEREIYSKEDLKELLNCFLQLNSPYYHGVIIRAFTEIWHSVFFAK